MKNSLKIAEKALEDFLKQNHKNEEFQRWNSLFFTPLFKNTYLYTCLLIEYYEKSFGLNDNFYQSPYFKTVIDLIISLVLKVKNNVQAPKIFSNYDLYSSLKWKENYYYHLSLETYHSLNLMQDYLFSIIKTICDFCQTKKDFHDLWTLLANFVEMCLINEETPYVTKKVLWFYKKDVVDVKYSNDYINAQIKAFDEIKTVLRFFLKDHLNDMILLINTLNKRPE